jgi:predicted HicB family RNase H-like nuclease
VSALRDCAGIAKMSPMSNSNRFDRLTIRLEPELRDAIERAAAADRRPVANFIINVLASNVDEPRRTGESQYGR